MPYEEQTEKEKYPPSHRCGCFFDICYRDVGSVAFRDQKRANENLRRQTENLEEYLEQQAREQGWALPGEVILMEIPGIDS